MTRNLNLELNQYSNDDIDTGTYVCAYVRKRVRVSESIIEPESRARKVMMTQYHRYTFYIPRTHLYSSRCRGPF